MREKKTEVLTIRVTAATKAAIAREAERRDWTPSKVAERILSSWAEQSSEKEIQVHFQQNTIQNVNIT